MPKQQFRSSSHTPRTRSRWRLISTVVAVLAALLMAAGVAPAADADGHESSAVVVANRQSGTISVIDTATKDVETHQLPAPDLPDSGDRDEVILAEPMYVSADSKNGLVLVGDRASSTVVAFDDETYEVLGSVPVGQGVFHQWLDVKRSRLWVVGDMANVITVVDTESLTVIASFETPGDLAGARPHDVFVDGKHAFVSFIGIDDGAIVAYDARNFAETGRIMGQGADPHLFVRAGRLHVASQDAGTVTQYKLSNLAKTNSVDVPTAHGIWVGEDNRVFVTNIAGGGIDGVWELDRRLRPVDTADTSAIIPHNLVVDDQHQLWVTHSGPNNVVSVISLEHGGLGGTMTIEVGDNPFGLAFVR